MKVYELGREIRRLRKEKGLIQEELAQDAGISRVTLSKLENGGTAGITVTVLARILERLGREIEFIEPGRLPTIEDLVEKEK